MITVRELAQHIPVIWYGDVTVATLIYEVDVYRHWGPYYQWANILDEV